MGRIRRNLTKTPTPSKPKLRPAVAPLCDCGRPVFPGLALCWDCRESALTRVRMPVRTLPPAVLKDCLMEDAQVNRKGFIYRKRGGFPFIQEIQDAPD